MGFSLWLDFIERSHLQEAFGQMVRDGVINGATSNPAIFAASITGSDAYAEQIAALRGQPPKAIYEALAIEDIRTAAKVLEPLYKEGNDGFVSLEVDPFFCDDTQKTVEEGKRLHAAVGMPNVMIKVPATDAGYAAMTALMAEGIDVNATLIFSPDQASRCLAAMREGLRRWRENNDHPVEGVLSVWVSRFDRMLDARLVEAGLEPGRVGVMNAAKIYNMVEAAGEPAVRTLFASTGVKGDAYEPDYYIKALMASHSVNTAPLATIEAFEHHPDHTPRLPIAEAEIEAFFARVEAAGVSMETVYRTLLTEGLEAFKQAFAELLKLWE
jgi:transaldolase